MQPTEELSPEPESNEPLDYKVDVQLADNVLITEENFDQYFFDVRKHKPKKSQIMACYTAVAYFADGNEKQNMIDLLKIEGKVEAAIQVMKKLHLASDKDAVRVLREMVEDLIRFSDEEDVYMKRYKYTLQMFFYTRAEYVPTDDPHWSIISVFDASKTIREVSNEVEQSSV